VFEGENSRGLEQNPDTKSRWAQMARSGKKVMQFLSGGRYVANVVDGQVTLYGKDSLHFPVARSLRLLHLNCEDVIFKPRSRGQEHRH